jgi:hypothetical protein
MSKKALKSQELSFFLSRKTAEVCIGEGRAVPGDLFGIEVECEGINVNSVKGEAPPGWVPIKDGSLRNNPGPPEEWIFNGPVPHDAAVKRVEELFDFFVKKKAVLRPSNRTSVHVHYNMGDKAVYQTFNLYIIFTILEGLLDRFCGEDRNGNLFCLSSRHAEEQLRWVQASLEEGGFANIRGDLRYCSLNLASLNKFCSVEFRGMRGVDNREDLLAWLGILKELTDYGCWKMGSPSGLIEKLSHEGPEAFLRGIFSPGTVALITDGLSPDEIAASLYEGLRLVQPLSYEIGRHFDKVRLNTPDFWAAEGAKRGVRAKKDKLDQIDDFFALRPPERGVQAVIDPVPAQWVWDAPAAPDIAPAPRPNRARLEREEIERRRRIHEEIARNVNLAAAAERFQND